MVLGNALHLPLADSTVQCCVTSPPYWGLRDYGVPGQLGLEATPDLYVASMVAVFREVWRVLRDDGVLFLNLGDSYASNAATKENPAKLSGGFESYRGSDTPTLNTDKQGRIAYRGNGIKGKDLIGIPWRVAFALQADGWYLRSDIIWAKPNPMPESVTDRPTKSHEYVFLLTKAARYYWDAEAVAEPASDAMRAQVAQGYSGTGTKDYDGAGVQNPSSVKARIIANARTKAAATPRHDGARWQCAPLQRGAGGGRGVAPRGLGRNLRSVWSIATQPYPEAHFATMPEKLVEPCIKAGSKPGDLVLDPFAGSGTVGVVCRRFARRFVGVELNTAYVGMATKRLRETQPGLALEAL
jgi:DNA modification methylase